MIGYHAASVIADAFLKGVKGFDPERAYAAVKRTAMNLDYDGLAAYRRLGWVPFDLENESLSKTLEYAYDDYCIAQMAKALGKKADYTQFMARAMNYTNLYDPSLGLMRPRDSNGQWRTPFNPHFYDENSRANDVTEGTSWQYSWYVPQDVPGLIALFGGPDSIHPETRRPLHLQGGGRKQRRGRHPGPHRRVPGTATSRAITSSISIPAPASPAKRPSVSMKSCARNTATSPIL